jgi:2-polyprenyl-6-methoxyphenol hydroxylase-like FAD-dependent oxidoreductase
VRSDGSRRAEMPVTAFDGSGWVSKLEILRGDLVDVLYQATKDSADYRFNSRISELERDDDAVAVTLADGGWHCDELLTAAQQADDFYFDSFAQVQMDSWSSGRVTLCGDAGYCASPLRGMGTGLALVGAYILAGELGPAGEGLRPNTLSMHWPTTHG